MTENTTNKTAGQACPKDKHPPAISCNWSDWLPYLEDQDILPEQKQELIQTLWSIMRAFADLGFELNPTQQVCGEVINLKAVLEADVLNLDHPEACKTEVQK